MCPPRTFYEGRHERDAETSSQLGDEPVTTLLITHPACLAHEMGEGHPERPDRLRAIECAFEYESRRWREMPRRALMKWRSVACTRPNISRRFAP